MTGKLHPRTLVRLGCSLIEITTRSRRMQPALSLASSTRQPLGRWQVSAPVKSRLGLRPTPGCASQPPEPRRWRVGCAGAAKNPQAETQAIHLPLGQRIRPYPKAWAGEGRKLAAVIELDRMERRTMHPPEPSMSIWGGGSGGARKQEGRLVREPASEFEPMNGA